MNAATKSKRSVAGRAGQKAGPSAAGIAPKSVVLGSGYDLRTQTVCITAVTGKTNSKPLDWQPSFSVDYMSTYEQVSKFFSLDASARYSGASGGFSASVSIVNVCNLERSKVVLAVSVKAITGTEFLDLPELTPGALEALSSTTMAQFASKYGGSYVRSISWGGELACLLVVSANSSETIDTLRAKIEAEGFGAHGSVETQQKISQLSKTNDIRVIYSQTGGGAGEGSNGKITEMTAAELLARMDAFIAELRSTDSLRGSVVPMEVEFWPPDKAQLSAFLVGVEEFPRIEAWPEVTFRTWWGYHGEDVGRYVGPHWRCAENEVHDPYVESAYPLSGKKPAINDGIFCLVSADPNVDWHVDGDHCGYYPMVIVAADVKKPDAPQMPPLPALPNVHFDPPEHEEGSPTPLSDGLWELPFVVKTGASGTTYAYTIEVTEKSAATKKTRVVKLPSSYWYTLKGGPISLKHAYEPGEDWSPMKFTVELGSLYMLGPDFAVLAGSAGQAVIATKAARKKSASKKAATKKAATTATQKAVALRR